ncbi:SLATT domain-containing protein [Dactylosporangium sp. NPDC051484]|uniref:SLATT domain-containing protein n=1 Tax=Dactylosporangium sp. NPDC051484 TaxID=3154942 RepID=UPI00344DE9BF
MAELVGGNSEELWRAAAREELLQINDDLLYTEKTHFATAETLHRVNLSFGLITTVLSTAAAATIVADRSPVAAGLLALGAAILSGVLTFVKPEQAAAQHLNAGRQLGALRVRARQVANLDLPRYSQKELRKLIADLVEEKAKIDAASPVTTGRNFNKARQRIQGGIFDRDDITAAYPADVETKRPGIMPENGTSL